MSGRDVAKPIEVHNQVNGQPATKTAKDHHPVDGGSKEAGVEAYGGVVDQ